MNHTENALKLVRKHLNTIHTHGTLFEQGMAVFLLARCLLAQLTASKSDESKAHKAEIFALLGRAKKTFERIEAFHLVKDVVFLETIFYDRLGYEKERNRQAMVFKQLDEQYPLVVSNSMLLFIGI